MMKRYSCYRCFACFLSAAVLVCSLAACGGGGASSAPQGTTDASRTEEQTTVDKGVSEALTSTVGAADGTEDTTAGVPTVSHTAAVTQGDTSAGISSTADTTSKKTTVTVTKTTKNGAMTTPTKTVTNTTKKPTKTASTKTVTKTTVRTTVAEVQLSWSLPVYEGGTPAQSLYDCGGGRDMGVTSKARMLVISDTTRAHFDAYLAKLKKVDYKETARHTVFDNVYVQFYRRTDQSLVYLYFISELGETRIIEDKASVPEPAFEYTCADGDVTVYQYAFMQDDQTMNVGTSWYEINGMFYIIRLADNRLICVDGATSGIQATKTAAEALWKFMQEITGTDKVRIACWYITHPHGDHYGFLQQLLQQDMTDTVTVERVMYNFNNPRLVPDTDATALGRLLTEKLPDAQYLKPHTGQRITLGNVDMDVLFTHEDFADPVTGKTIITNANNVSTVLRLHLNGRTLLLTGDWSGNGGSTAPPEFSEGMRRLWAMHTNDNEESYIKSDIYQIPHHGLNAYITLLTLEAAAEYAFVPAPDADLDTRRNQEPSWNVRQFITYGGNPDQVYFTSRYTYALHISRKGKITVAAEPIRGVDTGDDPKTTFVEEDYRNVTLKQRDPYRVPTKTELDNWKKIH